MDLRFATFVAWSASWHYHGPWQKRFDIGEQKAGSKYYERGKGEVVAKETTYFITPKRSGPLSGLRPCCATCTPPRYPVTVS